MSRVRVSTLARSLPLIQVDYPEFSGRKYAAKRAFDLIVSFLALVILSPLFLVLAVLVRRGSPGPALFTQERVGLNGRRFHMLKFRSMVVDAETQLPTLLDRSDGNGVLFKLKSDPRVTKIGAVLRRYSLDELPQLVNVLLGDMSLVGPRPPLASEVERYDEWTRRRLLVRPGITGLWQTQGRSDLTWEDSVRLDLYYVENWSLTGDVIILYRTIRSVARADGAY
jgi:exopolysaccharide biosynthesis polyprenyl glycosylphosphotransferase